MLKKFFEWTWPIATCILLSLVLVQVNCYIWSNSLRELVSWNVFWIMTSILWLTLASITFFLSKIIDLEEKFWKIFETTRKEIYDNIILSLSVVIVYLLILILYSDSLDSCIQYRIYTISLSLLLLQLFSFIEVCRVMIKFKTLKNK